MSNDSRLLLARIGISILAVLSAAIAFVIVCFPTGLAAFGMGGANPSGQAFATIVLFLGFGGGIAAGGFIAWFIIKKLWPRKLQ